MHSAFKPDHGSGIRNTVLAGLVLGLSAVVAANRRFKRFIVVGIILPAVLAPFWAFPALFKNLLPSTPSSFCWCSSPSSCS